MRSHAKAPTAASTQRRAKKLGRIRTAKAAVLVAAIASLMAFAATPASAFLLRNHEGSFGSASFGGEDPQALAVDQSSGDVYALDTAGNRLLRFDANGDPDNFSAGPNPGTNEISGLNLADFPFPSFDQVAVDSSGGPSNGNIYVTQSLSGNVKVFARDGEELGTLNGSGTPAGHLGEDCGVAVDQSNGDVYLASWGNRIWRYSPSGATVEESNYSGGIQTSINPCGLAVSKGSVYAKDWQESPFAGAGGLEKYATSEFALSPPSATATGVSAKATAVAADPANGDVYVDEGDKVSVFNASGSPLYEFGSGDVSFSKGVAVLSGGKAYVSDTGAHEIDAYETTLEPGSRAKLGSFGSFGSESPQALAVDQSNGDVYALDTDADKLLRFSSAGAPKDFSAGPNPGTNEIGGLALQDFPSLDQVAVDSSGGPSNGNIYVTQSGSHQVKVFAQSGEALTPLTGEKTPNSGFGEVCGVAVDQSNGDVYIASFGNRIWRYSPSGSTVDEEDYSGGIATSINPCGLAVAGGNLYAKDWQENPVVGGGGLRRYATSEFALGAPPSTTVANTATAVAADPSNGDVYVDEGNQVSVFNSVASPLYSFGTGDFGSSTGVAVVGEGNSYVSDSSAHKVDIYGPFSAPPPIVETKAATNVKHVKATLNGHLDPNGSLPITGCEFEWGEDTSYSEAPVPCVEGNSFNAAADVSAELSGLSSGTTYHFRLHVTTGGGGFPGEDKSFETTPASSVPEVLTGEGSIVSSTSSELKGSVDPNANPLTDCHFEYVNDLAFQSTGFSDLSSGGSVPCDQSPGSIPVDFEDHEVTATATGLDPEQVYRFRLVAENTNGPGNGKDALVPGPPLVETTGSTYRTTNAARFDSRVSPHGADTDYWFEYVTDAQFQASGFVDAVSTAHEPVVVDEVQRVEVFAANLGNEEPGGQFRLSFGGHTTPDLEFAASAAEVQAALAALPSIGVGNVHVDFEREFKFNARYTVTFQGALGNADVEQLVGSKGAPVPVGKIEVGPSGGLGIDGGGRISRSVLVSAPVSGLQPGTTYRYRLVADNGTPGGPSAGGTMTLTTHTSDAPLSHGHFPGPPGSDRAWEQVNAPDIGGNRVEGALALSDNGDRAVYTIKGGTPDSDVGSESYLFAERTPSGWQTSRLFATRAEATGSKWVQVAGRSDLSHLLATNYDATNTGPATVWALTPGLSAEKVTEFPAKDFGGIVFTVTSDDASRFAVMLEGSLDPDHPAPNPKVQNLYELSSGHPRLVDLLPDGSVPSCGVYDPINGGSGFAQRSQRWVSADGSRVFFISEGNAPCGNKQLYVRDLETETTTQISSGSSDARFLRSTVDAAFFTTESSLVPEDEGGNDVYRYDLEDESLECVTCVPGVVTEVVSSGGREVAISNDGSQVYFASRHRLLPGVTNFGLYRVDVGSGDLAFVAPIDGATPTGDLPAGGNAISPDGSVFVFRSASPALNSLNGPQNGNAAQYYRYDDDDRSLVCVSCPADGSLPRGAVPNQLSNGRSEPGPNLGPLSADGSDLAFVTPTPLVPADQNTAGPGRFPGEGEDAYEWRDGRLLLLTDGLTTTKVDEGGNTDGPEIAGVTPSGRDVFFRQPAQLTPDALDAAIRLYDARIGGGFEFPPPPPPCPLEACQGTPRGVPEESRPGSADFAGPGNVASHPARCRKGKVRRSGRCAAKKHKRHRAKKRSQHRANHDRRASR